MFKKMERQQNIFLQYLVPYIIILFIPFIASGIVYQKVFKESKKDAIEATQSILDQSRIVLESRLIELDNVVSQIALNSKINNLIKEGRDFYSYFELIKDLKNYKLTNNFIESIFVAFKNSNMIVRSDSIIDKPEMYYDLDFKYGDLSFAEWKEMVWSDFFHKKYIPKTDVIRNNKKESIVTYIQSIPIDYVDNVKGSIMILIKEDEIKKLIASAKIGGGWFYITDENGEIVASATDEEVEKEVFEKSYFELITEHEGLKEQDDIEKGKGTLKTHNGMIISYIISSYNNWTYVAAFPEKSVLSKANEIQRIYFVLSFFAIFIGIAVSYFLANRNSKAIKNIVSFLKDSLKSATREKNVYDYLKSSISEILKDNEKLKTELLERLPIVRTALIERLLRGRFNDLEEMKIAFSNAKIPIDEGRHVAAVLKVNGYGEIITEDVLSELNASKLIVIKLAEMIFKEKLLIQEIDEEKVVALFTLGDNNTEEDIEKGCNELCRMARQNNGIMLTAGIGNIYETPMELNKSFNEANEALESIVMRKGNFVICFSKLSNKTNSFYYYPSEIENKLIYFAKIGDKKKIKQFISEIYKENFLNRKLSDEVLISLLEDMKGTLLKLIAKLRVQEEKAVTFLKTEIEMLDKQQIINEIWEGIINIYYEVCSLVYHGKQTQLADQKQSMLEFINQNYMKPEFNLYIFASRYDMTETYMSRFFKEQTGETFSQFIERIRMENAVKLLSKRKYSINEIAELVGYTSAHTFRRVYKKIYGELPSTGR